jgi:hypothetical protein
MGCGAELATAPWLRSARPLEFAAMVYLVAVPSDDRDSDQSEMLPLGLAEPYRTAKVEPCSLLSARTPAPP